MSAVCVTAFTTRLCVGLTFAIATVFLHSNLVFADDQVRGLAPENWPVSGRASEQAHFSPLNGINTSNVSRLGLAWSFDIPDIVLATSEPIENDGVLYFAVGYSVVRALDAATGRLLWLYDPGVAKVAGKKLRGAWGVRGLAYSNHRIFIGTHDGRLLCIDAKSGHLVWSTDTVAGETRYITGPPLAVGDKILIGNGGSDLAPLRGYVTAYDAKTGHQVWRFYTVPGDPARGFENETMKMAASTWTGQWWKYGGGGAVWNAMSYDAQLHRVYIGTGNGTPWNEKIRSPQGGDNLFIGSIVALDADTGAYVWHYQTNPGESWDFDAACDLELATVEIDGRPRRVLLQASKNGFFYVIDRDTGKPLSAAPFVKVTWAEKIDMTTGRPVETANARYTSGATTVFPGAIGAHAAQPMAYNPSTGLAYIPALGLPGLYDDQGVDIKHWEPPSDVTPSVGLALHFGDLPTSVPGGSALVAWDPILQQARWRVEVPGAGNAGIATTAGQLVFQGRADGRFVAYDAKSGSTLWSFDAQCGIVGAPIVFTASGREYVAVLAGFGGPAAMLGSTSAQFGWRAQRQARRVLVFALEGSGHLPAKAESDAVIAVNDTTFASDAEVEKRGEAAYGSRCFTCHGGAAISGGSAPDLRASPITLSPDAFRALVQGGALVALGMPRFDQLSSVDLESIRQYIRAQAHAMPRAH
jgi:quinohemoprotein ethanol dehydrogenase